MTVPPPGLRALLFDLDGVLIDSLPAIAQSMNHALAAMGLPPRDAAGIRPLVGPPLEQSAAIALGTDDPEIVATWVGHFRGRYDQVVLTDTRPAPGLAAVLEALAGRFTCVVATSKPEAYAVPILEHLGVDPHFRAIVGRSLALDHDSKAQVVGRALGRLPAGTGPDQVLMIGDREHDVHGAAAHGISTVGVLHGMGDRSELEAAGARWIVDDLPALERWLRG